MNVNRDKLDERFWGEYFTAYDVLNKAIPYRELISEVVLHAKVRKGDVILDAGSGTGNISILLRKAGGVVLSFDFSSTGHKIHKKKDSQAQLILGDLTKPLPFESEKFDRIVTNNVIYAIEKQKRIAIFREFYRILKNDGLIVIANVRKGFSPSAILWDHLKKSCGANGIIKAAREFLSLAISAVKILYYNHRIKLQDVVGNYSFVEKGEQTELLMQSGFSVIIKDKVSYSGQSLIAVGKKEIK